MIISGTNKITTYVNEYHEEDYQAIDTKNEQAIVGDWTISNGTNSDKFTLNKTHDNTIAQLVWSSSAFSIPTNFDLTINCNSSDLHLNKSKTIHFEVLPSVIQVTSINIYGSTTLTGQKDIEGNSNYVAIDNNGHKVSGGTWSIEDKSGSAEVDINPSGQITWSDTSSRVTTFKVKYVKNNLEGISDLITLTIQDALPPAATSIDVWGSQELTGVGGYSGLSDYTASDNNGHVLTGVTWSIINASCSGVSINSSNGQVSWTDKATSGNFVINCHQDGLTDGTLNVNLTINNPTPPGPGPMPVSCLEISDDGKICYGLKGNVDLYLYNEIDIPEGVETIEVNAFGDKISSGYEYKLNLPDSLIEIKENAFNDCVGIEELNLGNGVTTIGKNAFNGLSRVRFLNIPQSVTSLGETCFSNMSDVVILNDDSNCQAYGTNVFHGTTNFSHWTTSNYVISSHDRLWNIFGENLKGNQIDLQIHAIGSSTTIGDGVPMELGMSNLVKIAIDNGITEIENSFFWYFVNLSSVSLPQSLIKIGSSAFGNCTKLEKVNIPLNLTTIGSFAFSNCENLLSLDLSGINNCQFDEAPVGEQATPKTMTFYNCLKLNEINLGNRAEQPQWTIPHATGNDSTFTNISATGNIIVSGSWTNKTDVLTFMQQWGLPSTGWTVNGV